MSDDLIQFEKRCIDPIAHYIIMESLEYAVDMADRRLSSVGKIFSQVGKSGEDRLKAVRAIMSEFSNVPVCGTPIARAKSEPPKKPPKSEKSPKPSAPKPPESKPTISVEKVEKPATSEEALLAKAKAVAAKPESSKKREGPPARWQEVVFHTRKGERMTFESPTALARSLGFTKKDISTADDMIDFFKKQGYELRVDGEGEPVKGEGGFVVVETIRSPHRTLAPPSEKTETLEIIYPKPWAKVTNKEGKLLRYEDAEGKSIPQSLWPTFSSEL